VSVPPLPRGRAGRAAIEELLRAPGSALLVSDYDGTLAPIVDDPARAAPQPGALEALAELARVLGGVAVVTGREVSGLLHVADLGRVEGVEVLGLYGAQRWSGGPPPEPTPPAGLAEARASLAALAAAEPGAWVEDKGLAVAVHTRPAADPAGALARLRAPVSEVAGRNGLLVESGRYVLELRAPGSDKGRAVRALLAERHPTCVVCIGDDAADLPAFAVLAEARAAGGPAALLVASSSTEEPRVAVAADVVLDGPEEVVALLAWLSEQLARP